MKFNPPKVEGKDDITGEDLIQRKDDNAAVLNKRLEAYHTQTAPILDFYQKKGVLRSINAMQDMKKVWEELERSLAWFILNIMKSKKARSSSRSVLDKPNVTALLQSLQSQDLNIINRALEVIAQYLYSSTPQIKSNSSIIIAQVSHILPALRAGIDSSLTHLKPHPLHSRVL